MLGIQDYRWKKITIDNNKNSKISDSWKDWKPRTNENRDWCWKTVALEAKLQIFWQIRSFASKSVGFQAKLGHFDPFRAPPDAAPISIVSLHSLPVLIWVLCHMIIWWSHETSGTTCSYIEISPREQRFSILSCWRPANNLIESIVCCVVLL